MTDEGIRLALKIHVPRIGPGGATLRRVIELFRFVPLKVKRRGAEMRLIINGGDKPRKPDPALLKAFARARGGSKNWHREVRQVEREDSPTTVYFDDWLPERSGFELSAPTSLFHREIVGEFGEILRVDQKQQRWRDNHRHIFATFVFSK